MLSETVFVLWLSLSTKGVVSATMEASFSSFKKCEAARLKYTSSPAFMKVRLSTMKEGDLLNVICLPAGVEPK